MTHSHTHHHAHDSKKTPLRALSFAIGITLLYAGIEAITGWYSGSLTLLGDAGHMLSDALALSIAAFASWVALKPASKTHSYGFGRAEVIAAWISSLILFLISLCIIVAAAKRMSSPISVHGVPVIIVAFIGMLVNLLTAGILSRTENTLNVRAAFLHVLSDLLGSFAALAAGAIIYFTGWFPIDSILSMVVGILIIISSFRLLRESLRILMEGVPAHIDFESVSESLSKVNGVLHIHDLHIWTLPSGSVALSAHVAIHEFTEWAGILKKLTHTLEHHHHIHHITLQPEPDVFECKPCK